MLAVFVVSVHVAKQESAVAVAVAECSVLECAVSAEDALVCLSAAPQDSPAWPQDVRHLTPDPR